MFIHTNECHVPGVSWGSLSGGKGKREEEQKETIGNRMKTRVTESSAFGINYAASSVKVKEQYHSTQTNGMRCVNNEY